MKKAPTTLIIMDGFGLSDQIEGNAVRAAKTPKLDRLFQNYAHTTLSASGLDVGLPDGQMGNSEVGHTNIGGGRVVYQDLPRITRAIEDGTFFENPAYNAAMDACLEKGTALHLMGLHSDGGVHSTLEHLYALLKMASIKGLKRVYVHCFLDGRDVSPTSGKGFVAQTVKKCSELGIGKIATVMGRYYAMDRDKRWERVEAAYDALVYGDGIQNANPVAAVAESYENGVTDEFVEPIVCDKSGMISDNDSVIFFNFRPDRARELTRTLVDPDFNGFKCEHFPLTYVCNTEYDATMPNVLVAFPRLKVENNLGEYLSRMGMTQLRIAETEKYAHVTFFFNGGVERQYEGEDRVLVPSPKVATYDLKPEMSAPEVTEQCVERILSGEYDVVILNFANCDMVGHTGVFEAAVRAVETVDACVGKVVEATLQMGGIAMVTADHGNSEQMLQSDGKSPMTAHTTNRVPFILCGAGTELRPGRLADIAPTILDLLGLEQPPEMDGKTLIVK
ncbi:MAG: 2,3-bisphosphoglycerate-independent phosphoglycerate mutase [Ruminococcaceae bacterium]|nr:2,3-bisphosphoglycerate-independent phosphoglycerate mutase [Oscillospiraceae bacterium]